MKDLDNFWHKKIFWPKMFKKCFHAIFVISGVLASVWNVFNKFHWHGQNTNPCNVILLCQNWLRAPAFYHQPTKKIGPKIAGKNAILKKVISLFWLSCSVILLCQNWLDMGFYWGPQHLSKCLGYLKIDEKQSVNLLKAISNYHISANSFLPWIVSPLQ